MLLQKRVLIPIVLLAVAALIAYAITPRTSVQPVAGIPVSFTELAHGDHSDVSRRANYLIESNDELSILWKMIDASAARPDIDFSKDVVIAVFMGAEPTLGYSIAVASVEDGDNRAVAVTLTRPGGSCVLDKSVTQPYQIIVLPKTSLAFAHKDQVRTVGCLQ